MLLRGQTGLELLKGREKVESVVRLNDGVLDWTMGGGFLVHGITEISGEAGAGKTQFCLSLALMAYLEEEHGGLNSSAIYLNCGEGPFPMKRLEVLAKAFEKKYSKNGVNPAPGKSANDFLNHVIIETMHNTEMMLEAFREQIPNLIRSGRAGRGAGKDEKPERPARLLIVDSLAGLVRTEFDTSSQKDMKYRTSTLFTLASKLKWLSDTYNLCVIVVNQVTAAGFDNGGMLPAQLPIPMGGKIGTSCGLEVKQDTQPALGLAWSHCVNTRVLLRKDSVFMHGGAYWSTSTSTSTSQDNEDQEQQHRQGQFQGQEQQSQSGFGAGSGSGRGAITTRRANRSMHLEFSPVCGARACTYKITGDGLEGETRLYGCLLGLREYETVTVIR